MTPARESPIQETIPIDSLWLMEITKVTSMLRFPHHQPNQSSVITKGLTTSTKQRKLIRIDSKNCSNQARKARRLNSLALTITSSQAPTSSYGRGRVNAYLLESGVLFPVPGEYNGHYGAHGQGTNFSDYFILLIYMSARQPRHLLSVCVLVRVCVCVGLPGLYICASMIHFVLFFSLSFPPLYLSSFLSFFLSFFRLLFLYSTLSFFLSFMWPSLVFSYM